MDRVPLTGSGDFQEFNSFSGVTVNAANVLNEVKPLLDDSVAVTAVAVSSSAQTDAKRLNVQGEAAYQSGNLDQAIDLFRQAIELDNGFGKAYGNLGLAYQKAGNTAESIWANRKAIALATGANAATVRAGAYYNIALLRSAGFCRCLAALPLAKGKRPSVYETIERVRIAKRGTNARRQRAPGRVFLWQQLQAEAASRAASEPIGFAVGLSQSMAE